MLAETVDPANGTLSVRVAVPQPMARGFVLPFAFAYDSNSAALQPVPQNLGQVTWMFNKNVFAPGAWSNTLPQLSAAAISYADPLHPGNTCHGTSGYVFQDPVGGRHGLNLSAIIDNSGSPWCVDSGWQAHTTAGDNYYSAWVGNYVSGLFYQAGNGEVRVANGSGTVYHFIDNGGSHAWGVCSASSTIGYAMPSTVEDRNGNVATISNPCGGNFTVTDTVGRAALSIQSTTGQVTSVAVPGFSSPYTATWATATPSGISVNAVQIVSDTHCSGVPSWGGGGASRISAITLPNGTQYQFSYDPVYGTLDKVLYPSGGYVSYTWGLNAQSAVVTYPDATNAAGTSNACQYRYDRPAILHRYVSFDGTNIARQDDFSYSTTWAGSNQYSWTNKQTTVTTHDLVAGVTFQTVYSYAPGNAPYAPNMPSNFSELQMPLEQTIVYKGATGNTLKTTTKGWDPNPYGYKLGCEFQTLDNGQISGVLYGYPFGIGSAIQLTDKLEYDYGLITSTSSCQAPSGVNPTRETSISYQAFASTPIFPSAPSILDKPASVSTYGNGILLAQTLSSYDQAVVSDVPNLPTGTHDEANYAATSSAPRGNPTTITRKCLQTCPDVVKTSTFDKTGQVLSSTDPCGNVACADMTGSNHTTTYSYADNFDSPPSGNTNAYLTKVTDALGHFSTFKYAYADGQLISSVDQNTLITSHLYNDPLRRLTETDLPDGGSTSVSYNDSPPSPSVTTSKKINSSQTITTTTVMDGFGHVKQTQLTSDPQGTVYTDTTFDGFGRVWKQSNPYRSGTDLTTTTGNTIYAYDSLGRKLSETYPDNSVLTTAYCGPSTLVTDPTQRWRRSRTDGLGRLVEVDEPNAVGAAVNSNGCVGTGEPIWITSYGFDSLNNLISVVQNGSRSRSFSYDSLSRMLTSNNPEVGTITYTYDADGNVSTKKDARAITTTYSYDALNRTTQASYSDGTPIASYRYDETAPWGWTLSNPIGRKTTEYTNDIATGTMLTANLFSYDTMGRPLILEQCQPQNCASAPSLSTTVSYDYAGNPTALTYPSGRVVRYTYDSADRSSTAADGSSGVTYATGFKTSPGGSCANNITCYTPQGTFYALSFGQTSSFNGVNLTHIYNSRLQPQEFKASSSGGNAIDVTYNFQDPLNSNKNAGHVFSITNNLDSTRSQNFTYDQLNRIASALTTSTHATSPSHCWGETYALDAWANLNSIAATTNSAYTGCSQESGFSQTATSVNRLPGLAYDASGNTSSDGVNGYTWDGESQLKTAAGMTYTYDAEGRRVAKSSGKTYVYGLSGEILAEVDASGHTTAEYIFFGGKRVATIPSGGNPSYYIEDLLGTSRVLTTNAGAVCYDADFYAFGGERPYTNTCSPTYKFEGKERDTETGNDDFGARYYSNRFGRWLSADWSSVPVAVPYANLANPQTLNLYSMVADDPESFADLDGHFLSHGMNTCHVGSEGGSTGCTPWETEQIEAAAAAAAQEQAAQQQQQSQTQNQNQQQNTNAPANSRTDVVLYGRENTPTPGRDYTASWTMDWYAGSCSGDRCSQSAENREQTISLVEKSKETGWEWKPTGEPQKGVAHDQISPEAKTFNQHWFVNNKQVQIVVGKDSKGNLIKTWEVHVVINKIGDRPTYSPVP
jgi:RHS repeat-associated protein